MLMYHLLADTERTTKKLKCDVSYTVFFSVFCIYSNLQGCLLNNAFIVIRIQKIYLMS